MRDIRTDLQDRAKMLEEQIGAAQSQFHTFIEQLRREHQSKLNDLKSDFGTLQRVMKMEDRLVGVLSFSKAPSEPNPPRQLWHQQAQS